MRTIKLITVFLIMSVLSAAFMGGCIEKDNDMNPVVEEESDTIIKEIEPVIEDSIVVEPRTISSTCRYTAINEGGFPYFDDSTAVFTIVNNTLLEDGSKTIEIKINYCLGGETVKTNEHVFNFTLPSSFSVNSFSNSDIVFADEHNEVVGGIKNWDVRVDVGTVEVESTDSTYKITFKSHECDDNTFEINTTLILTLE